MLNAAHRSFAVAAAALTLLSACAEDPSFEARWRLGDPGDGSGELTVDSVRACTAVGLESIRVTAIQAGLPVDARDLPCFASTFTEPAGLIGGPELADGDYELRFEGVLRSGKTICEAIDAEPCFVSRDAAVRKGQPLVFDDLVIPRAPQCRDGVDNDGDGRVDGGDPGCLCSGVAGGGEPTCAIAGRREDDDITRAYFAIRASLLDQNPQATCVGAGITALRAELRRLGSDEIIHSEALACAFNKQLFDLSLDPGVYTLTTRATAAGDQTVAVDQPARFCVPRPDPADDGCSGPDEVDLPRLFVDLAVDFSIDEFLAPLASPLRFVVEYEPAPGLPPRGCAPPVGGGQLTVDSVVIEARVLDAQGAESPLALNLEGGEPLADPRPCPGTILTTEAVEWSPDQRDYRLAIRGLSPEGDTCFDSGAAPVRAAPGVTFVARVPRAASDGTCRDCAGDAECGGGTCDDAGICLP